jgi:hypothetical protein
VAALHRWAAAMEEYADAGQAARAGMGGLGGEAA